MSKFGVTLHNSPHIIDLSRDTLPDRRAFVSVRGKPALQSKIRYTLVLDPKKLIYAIDVPKTRNCDPCPKGRRFKAGLWLKDVFELFLAGKSGERYQEFNFSPTGRYWTIQFSKYRKEDLKSEKPLPRLKISIKSGKHGTRIAVCIPREGLLATPEQNARIQCSAVWGKNPRTFFSSGRMGKKPDFHDVARWGKTKLVTFDSTASKRT